MEYPEVILKGIPSKNELDESGYYPSIALFRFEPNRSLHRNDGYIEDSICWKDDEQAISLVLNQKKEDGSIQFKVGVAILEKKKIDLVIKTQNFRHYFKYERDIKPENPYHGNLLLKKDAGNHQLKKIRSAIANTCEEIILREKY